MAIPGIPGASEPTFLTRDRSLVSFDTLIRSVCEELDELGQEVSAHIAKAVVQCARDLVNVLEGQDGFGLSSAVASELRSFHILVLTPLVQLILTTYAQLTARLDIAQVHEI
jgi:hypothetical protein